MKKPVVRIISLVIVLMLVLGMLSGVLSIFAGAAVSQEILAADTTVSPSGLTTGKIKERVKITFRFKPSDDYAQNGPVGTLGLEDFSIPAGSSFAMSTKSKLKIDDSKGTYYEATISDILYNGGSAQALELYVANAGDPDEPFYFYVPLPSKYFKEGSSEAEDVIPKSNIVWQSTIVRDAAGQKVGKVDKNTGRVTVEVSFYDIGLKNESNAAIDAAKKYVFITSPAGFKLHKGTMGTLERVASSAEYPRFKATFEDVEFSGNIDKMNFRVQYEFQEYEQGVEGTGEATLFQITSESDEPDETETAPLKPNVIVQEYSYGQNAIIAGNEFNLDMVFANTSRTVAVENVVMKINPASGFYIAAASNTVYFPSLGAGESKPYSVALKAMPSQSTGVAGQTTDYSVTIEFSYQYQINQKGDYGDNATSVKIAIPVEQLDRFIVDEITDYSQYMQVGQEGYLTVPITNKGKSAIMNISGMVESKSGMEFTAPPVYYGNLDAGKPGTINISITVNATGEFSGEAVILYEDENMNQKEIRQPFVMMVQEPYVPPVEMPDTPDMQPQGDKPSPVSVALIVIGGLMLASPAALILMKRVKARGNEDLDEDF